MKRFTDVLSVVAVCMVIACIGCKPDSPNGNDVVATDKSKIPSGENTAVVFLTGNILSTLQPCGCSAGQLGGFDRRKVIIESVDKDNRAVIDTGNMLAGDSEQDIIKLGIMFQALSILRYDAVNLNAREMKIAEDLGLTDVMPFSIISTGESNHYSKMILIGDEPVTLKVISVEAESIDGVALEQQLQKTPGLSLNIVIIDNCSKSVIQEIEDMGFIDVLVCPTDADEPRIIDKTIVKPLVVSVGRLGKYFGKLTVNITADNELKLGYDKIPIDEKLKQDEELVQLYKDYQLIVKEEGLLAKVPRVPLSDGLKYLGSENCHSCHGYEFDKWANQKHAHAYETLVKAGSESDPECIGCHVVGFGYESGFDLQKYPDKFKGVGCEVCHGPGSKHFQAMTTGKGESGISGPKTKCIECHTTERSPGYQGHEAEYLEKTSHWQEQKDKNSVKK